MGKNSAIMKNFSRRDFIQSAAPAALSLFLPISPISTRKQPFLLSFSTLGCPDWPFDKILDFALANQYNGIELRGILRQMDLPKCPEFNTPENISQTLRKIADKGLKIVDLGSSCSLHHNEPAERQKNIGEGKRFIDLADQLQCPYIRVFPNELPKDDTRRATIDRIIGGLQELGDYAKGRNVTVLMESHGDAVRTDELALIMGSVDRSNTGLVWDVVNMWTVTKEPPASVYRQLKPYIRHTHIKDAKLLNGQLQYVLLGTGDTPIFDAIDVLYKDGYSGYYSFEWEKLWHPDILDPEIALADYPRKIKAHFK
jgi:sugar phosphate isomerase/epimerase